MQGVGASDQKTVEGHREGHGWKHPRAPSGKWLWKEESTEAVLAFLGSTRIGCISARIVAPEEVEGAGSSGEGEEGGAGPPGM